MGRPALRRMPLACAPVHARRSMREHPSKGSRHDWNRGKPIPRFIRLTAKRLADAQRERPGSLPIPTIFPESTRVSVGTGADRSPRQAETGWLFARRRSLVLDPGNPHPEAGESFPNAAGQSGSQPGIPGSIRRASGQEGGNRSWTRHTPGFQGSAGLCPLQVPWTARTRRSMPREAGRPDRPRSHIRCPSRASQIPESHTRVPGTNGRLLSTAPTAMDTKTGYSRVSFPECGSRRTPVVRRPATAEW